MLFFCAYLSEQFLIVLSYIKFRNGYVSLCAAKSGGYFKKPINSISIFVIECSSPDLHSVRKYWQNQRVQ